MTSFRFACITSALSVLVCAVTGCPDGGIGGGAAIVVAVAANMCETDERCDDGAFCNGVEFCFEGFCQGGEAPCGEAACDGELQTCAEPCTEEQCGDGLFCNGEEFCTFPEGDPNGFCTTGILPCFDNEVCSESRDACVGCNRNSDCPEGEICVEDVCVEGSEDPITLSVILTNEDVTMVHVLTDSESFDSSNRLNIDGGTRIVTFGSVLVGDRFTFNAGTNGSVFATVECTYDPLPTQDSVVTWTGLALECSGSLR